MIGLETLAFLFITNQTQRLCIWSNLAHQKILSIFLSIEFMSVARYYELKYGKKTEISFRIFSYLILIPKLAIKPIFFFFYEKLIKPLFANPPELPFGWKQVADDADGWNEILS